MLWNNCFVLGRCKRKSNSVWKKRGTKLVRVELGAHERQSQQLWKPKIVICSDTVFCVKLEVIEVEQLWYMVFTVHLKDFHKSS